MKKFEFRFIVHHLTEEVVAYYSCSHYMFSKWFLYAISLYVIMFEISPVIHMTIFPININKGLTNLLNYLPRPS